MRNLIFTTIVLLSLNTFAQWETKYFVDDFGDDVPGTGQGLLGAIHLFFDIAISLGGGNRVAASNAAPNSSAL